MSLARHTVYNLSGQLLPLVLSLLTTPVYLRLIGEARFGVLALLWLFLGYMGLFDLGMGQAAARELAKPDDASPMRRDRVFWTALLLALGLGLLGAVVAGALGAWLFGQQLPIEEGLRQELLASLPWALVLVPCAALAGVLNGGLQARSAFAEINLIGALNNTLMLLAPLAVAAGVGVRLAGLVAAVAAARLLVLGLLLWRCQRHYAPVVPVPIDRQDLGGLLRFGSWATISATIGPLLVVLDRFLIGAQIGARSVSHYVIPFQLAERSTMLASALGAALFPRFASSPHEADRLALARQGLGTLAVWTSAPVALALLLAGPFLRWWISPELALHSTPVAQVLCVAFWVSSLATVPYIQLLAAGRPDLVAKCHLIQLLPYLALLYAALQAWGLVGAAVAFAARVVLDFLLLAHWARVLAPACRMLAVPTILLAATLAVAPHGTDAAPWRWACGGALSAGLALWSLARLRNHMPFSGLSHL